MMHRWLHTGRLAVLTIAVACAPARAQQTPTPAAPPAAPPAVAAAPAANPSDVATPEAVVTALYDVISGPASQQRDWDRFRSLFIADARLAFVQPLRSGEERLYAMNVEEFIRNAGPGYQTGAGFWEREIGSRIDRFGAIAHVFTAYETRRTGADGPVAARGINSVQMLRHQGRWWITHLVFDSETAANAIPQEYLRPRGQ